MAKITLPAITNGQDLTNINNNFALIAAALNNNVFYRTNVGSEANSISQDTDFNGHALYNVSDILINGVSYLTAVTQQVTLAQTAASQAMSYATTAQGYANSSSASAVASAASAVVAQNAATAAGTLKIVNNLSDLNSIPIAKVNLALDQVNNTSDAAKPLSTAAVTALAAKAPTVNPVFTGNTSVVTVVATGLITPASNIGIKATVAADNAPVGSIGNYVETAVSAATSISAATATNIQTLVLQPGDWDVYGTAELDGTGTIVNCLAGLSLTSATLGGAGLRCQLNGTITNWSVAVPFLRVNVSVATTVYLVAFISTVTATATTQGKIMARSAR